MAVMELCLDGLPAGKGMDVPVKKSISSVWEKCQLVFPGYRAGKVTELCMEKCKGLQHVSCLFPEKTVLGRVGKRAYGSRKPLIRMGTCCFQKGNSGFINGGKLFEYIIKCHGSILLFMVWDHNRRIPVICQVRLCWYKYRVYCGSGESA